MNFRHFPLMFTEQKFTGHLQNEAKLTYKLLYHSRPIFPTYSLIILFCSKHNNSHTFFHSVNVPICSAEETMTALLNENNFGLGEREDETTKFQVMLSTWKSIIACNDVRKYNLSKFMNGREGNFLS